VRPASSRGRVGASRRVVSRSAWLACLGWLGAADALERSRSGCSRIRTKWTPGNRLGQRGSTPDPGAENSLPSRRPLTRLVRPPGLVRKAPELLHFFCGTPIGRSVDRQLAMSNCSMGQWVDRVSVLEIVSGGRLEHRAVGAPLGCGPLRNASSVASDLDRAGRPRLLRSRPARLQGNLERGEEVSSACRKW